MRYLIKIDELRKKTEFLEKEIDKIRQYIESIKAAKEFLVWEGTAHDKFIQKYDEYLEQLNTMLRELIKILLFYKSFYSDYDEEYRLLKEKYNDLLLAEEKDDELY